AGDGSGRLFALDQSGVVYEIPAGGGAGTSWLDISVGVTYSPGGHQGAHAIAFHPDFATNGKLYISYTNKTSQEQVTEFTVTGDPLSDPPAPATIRPVLPITLEGTTNMAGQLAFGLDGYLYVSVGDSGTSANGQAQDKLFSKILRIDVDGDSEGEYGLPAGG